MTSMLNKNSNDKPDYIRSSLLLLRFLVFFTLSLLNLTVNSQSQDTIVYVFKETFENIGNMKESTVIDKWQVRQQVYQENSQSLVNVGGEHGNVWQSVYHEGLAAGMANEGAVVDIIIGEYDELWFESDLYADPDFNPYSAAGKFSGKMLFGFAGGNELLGDNGWVLDSSATGNGWDAHGVWGSNYALRPYYYDQKGDGQSNQLNANLVIPRGYWIHITRRVKMNTPGKSDGIYEVYINDVLAAQATNVEWRSYAQGKDYGKISALYLAYVFGGAGAEYASQRDNYIRADNFTAYYYTPKAKTYLTGPAPQGYKIPRNIPTSDLYPDRWLFDEVFTASSGLVQTHYNCGAFSPTSNKVIKKEIYSSTDTVNLRFLSFDAGVDNDPYSNSYTKVYSGTGDSKKLLYTFNKQNKPQPIYTILAQSVTIEYYSGNSQSKGWKLRYTTTANLPSSPSNLSSTALNARSIRLSWSDNSDNENGFSVYRSDNEEGAYQLIGSVGDNSTSYTDGNLQANTTYYYYVISFNDNGISIPSAVHASTTLSAQLPTAPDNLRTGNLSYTSVVLSWTDNANNEKGVQIERTGPNNTIVTYNTGTNSTSYTDTKLVSNTSYTYRVRAYNDDGYSGYSNSVQITTPYISVPTAPSLLSSGDVSDTSITIKWKDNSSNEKAFVITKSCVTNDEEDVTINVSANTSAYIDNSVKANTTYQYVVRAANEAGTSSPSNQYVVSTLSLAETKRVKDGLIAYYNFGYSPDNYIKDLSGFDPLNLRIMKPSYAAWDDNNRMELTSGTIVTSSVPAVKIIKSSKKTGELSVECWIKPKEKDILSNARVLSLSSNNTNIGFILDQTYQVQGTRELLNYSVRLRTGSTNASGFPEITSNHELAFINLTHIVFTRDSLGTEKLYINGEKTAEGFRPGDLSVWTNDFVLKLGNEGDMLYPWKGTYYLVAIYNKELTQAEVKQNYSTGPCDNLQKSGTDWNILVYPNPCADIINLSIVPLVVEDYYKSPTFVRVFDIYGKLHYERTLFSPDSELNTSLDTRSYSKGMYLLQVISGTHQKTTRFIVQ